MNRHNFALLWAWIYASLEGFGLVIFSINQVRHAIKVFLHDNLRVMRRAAQTPVFIATAQSARDPYQKHHRISQFVWGVFTQSTWNPHFGFVLEWNRLRRAHSAQPRTAPRFHQVVQRDWNSGSSIKRQNTPAFSKWNWRKMMTSYRVWPSYLPPSRLLISTMKNDRTLPKWFLLTQRGSFRLQNIISCGHVGILSLFWCHESNKLTAHCTLCSVFCAKVLLLSCAITSSNIGDLNLFAGLTSPPPVHATAWKGSSCRASLGESVEVGWAESGVSSSKSGSMKPGAKEAWVDVQTALKGKRNFELTGKARQSDKNNRRHKHEKKYTHSLSRSNWIACIVRSCWDTGAANWSLSSDPKSKITSGMSDMKSESSIVDTNKMRQETDTNVQPQSMSFLADSHTHTDQNKTPRDCSHSRIDSHVQTDLQTLVVQDDRNWTAPKIKVAQNGLKTRLSSRESAAGRVHRQDSTCPNLPIPQSENVRVGNIFFAGGGTRTISEIP